MKNQIVAALSIFKMDVYANLTSKDSIKNYLINQLGQSVWSGQKRLVVFDQNNSGSVYKIAYSTQGIIDNIHEVACSERLKELHQQGFITADDVMLFGEARLIDGDPFVIEQRAVVNFVQDPDFVQWFNSQNRGDMNENQVLALYVAQHANLANQYNRIQSILSQYFKPSDATIFKEPKNFGFITDSMGNKRIVLIDLGSICPNLMRNGQVVKITCDKCGSSREYVSFQISAALTQDTVNSLEGVYLCDNPNCADFKGRALEKTTDHLSKDSFVYTKFLQDNADLVRVLRAQYGLFFIPDREVSSKVDYLNDMVRILGVRPDNNILNIMYRNYLSVACGFLASQFLDDIRNIQYVTPQNNLITFSDYLNQFNSLMLRNNHQVDEVTKRTAALMYLSLLASGDNDKTVFDTLTSPDWNTFANICANKFHLDQHNGSLIYRCLHTN